MGKGHFTDGGHLIVLSDVSEINGTSMFTVLDPNDNNGRWKKDGKIVRTDHPGIVYAQVSIVDNENKSYFIFTLK